MSGRVYNFSAGPACLPRPVIEQAQKDIGEIFDSGMSVLELSHRGKEFDRITAETLEVCHAVTKIPDDYAVFWMQGGATSQCYLVPANFLAPDRTADYFQTGKWAKDSIKEAPLYGKCHICASGESTNYSTIPAGDVISYSDNPVYVHFTANNTIMGTEFHADPTPPDGSFLVCDASSNIFSKPIDITKYGLIYAGAQKNLGPAGITLVIARKGLIAEPVRDLPTMMQFRKHADKEGRFNTPPTFGVYLMGRVFRWITEQGGLDAMAERNQARANILYTFLDSQDFYIPHATTESRSNMNITFRCPTPELDKAFVAGATERGLRELKGHRSIGGMRASMYNAFPTEGAEALVSFMKEFALKHASAAASS
jgi:phosphoserine aminotransferase